MAAAALMFAIPMSWALLTFGNLGAKVPEPTIAMAVAAPGAEASSPLDSGPGVTITLDPSSVAYPQAPESNTPLVVPAGYLVPDHGSGDAVHEGD